MRKHKKTRANSGETLVEVTASIFIFLIMLGIIQGAISYSQASLAKNKEIRSEKKKSSKDCKVPPHRKKWLKICSLWRPILT